MMSDKEIKNFEKNHVIVNEKEIEEEIQRYSAKYDQNEKVLFEELYDEEMQMQRRSYGASWPWDIDRYAKKYTMNIHLEVDEALRCTNYKDHKRPEEIDLEHFRDEIVDVFLYTLAFSGIAFKNAEDFLEAAYKKLQYNKTRQDWDINK